MKKQEAKTMKLTTQILIALFAISIGTSTVVAQIKKGYTKHHVKEGKHKNSYQVAIDPIIEKSGLETKEEVISCLEGKKSKMNWVTKGTFSKYKKGSKLSKNDEDRLLSQVTSCSSTDKIIPEPPKSNTKKGYQSKSKISKGQKKGKIG